MLRAFFSLLLGTAAALSAPVDLFRAGDGGYDTYRIPALITSSKGTLLAFCEGRRHSSGDTGDIDILLRRSFDQGRTWEPVRLVVDFGADTAGNPTPVVERSTGAIFLLMTSNDGHVTEHQIITGVAPNARRVWVLSSRDDGATWTQPREITATIKLPGWTWYATGPGNGIQLDSGRLVIPCDHNTDREGRYSHLIYSDDRGETWKIGAIAEVKTNESAVVERKDGSVMINMRSYHARSRRATQVSRDGGLTFEPLQLDPALVEPICQASLITTRPLNARSDGRLLFSNPADPKERRRLTVRLSDDDGATWKYGRVIEEGPSAYSSLAMVTENTVGLLYETGVKSAYERIVFESFAINWTKVQLSTGAQSSVTR